MSDIEAIDRIDRESMKSSSSASIAPPNEGKEQHSENDQAEHEEQAVQQAEITSSIHQDSTPEPRESAENNAHSRIHKAFKTLLHLCLDQWFLLTMSLLILLSSQTQVPLAHQPLKRSIITYLSVSLIFFINGCTLPTPILIENYFRWKLHLFVQLQCFLLTSAATFGIVSACASNPTFMDPWLLIGLLFVGSAPTTMNSNVVMTRQANGNVALTVVQSTIGQALCPFLTPIIVQMYLASGAWYTRVVHPGAGAAAGGGGGGGGGGTDYAELYRRVFKQLGLSIFIPMAVGQVVQNVFPRPTHTFFVEWKIIKVSSFALLTLIWQTFDQAFAVGAFKTVETSNIVFLVFISVALYFVWLGICFGTATLWLGRRDVVACCYCAPAKALAMVVPLTAVMYVDLTPINQSKLQIPAILYQGIQLAIGGVLTMVFRRWILRSEQAEEDREKAAETPQG